MLVFVYLSVCPDVVVAVLGVVGDYSKFGLLSYISRGKQPRIQQVAQYHSNNTELSEDTLPQILISAQNLKLIAKVDNTYLGRRNLKMMKLKTTLFSTNNVKI